MVKDSTSTIHLLDAREEAVIGEKFICKKFIKFIKKRGNTYILLNTYKVSGDTNIPIDWEVGGATD